MNLHKEQSIEKVETALATIRNGGMVVVIDDEDRENEGDLCMAAEFATPQAINFMAVHARGLICLTLAPDLVDKLGLPMMVDSNRSPRQTAFTVSIEAREGVSTGISAADRAHTILTAVRPEAKASDIVSPGHVFPLRARPGGVLQRAGHTEGSVDLARLAGSREAAVICEIMNPDGTMARFAELVEFARTHGLPLISIADLVEYRMQTERLVQRVSEHQVPVFGHEGWRQIVYRTSVENREIIALVLGEPSESPCLVRVQAFSFLGDVLEATLPWRTSLREAALSIAKQGAGVIVLFVGAQGTESERWADMQTPSGNRPEALREYGLGAQVLRDLGLHQIRLISKRPLKLVGLEGYGLVLDEIVAP